MFYRNEQRGFKEEEIYIYAHKLSHRHRKWKITSYIVACYRQLIRWMDSHWNRHNAFYQIQIDCFITCYCKQGEELLIVFEEEIKNQTGSKNLQFNLPLQITQQCQYNCLGAKALCPNLHLSTAVPVVTVFQTQMGFFPTRLHKVEEFGTLIALIYDEFMDQIPTLRPVSVRKT